MRPIGWITCSTLFLWILPQAALPGPAVVPDEFMDPEMMERLELTPDQIRQLQALKELYLNDIGPLQNKLFSKKAEFRRFWHTTGPNRQECMDRQQEIWSLYQQISRKTIQFQLDCRSLLTPEQETVWFQKREERQP